MAHPAAGASQSAPRRGSHGLRRCSRRAVVGQRRPRGDKTVVGRNGIVLRTAVLAGKPTSVLPMSTPSEHGVDVQRVDLAREARPRAASAAAPSLSKITIAECWPGRGR